MRVRHQKGETFRIVTACDGKTWLTWPTALTEISGLAMPRLEHRTSRSPFQHGETLLGTVLRPRMVQIVMHLRGCDRPQMWALRTQMLELMNPLLGVFKFQILFDDGNIFELRNVVFDAGFTAGTIRQIQPETQGLAFRLIAYDPVWYSPLEGVEASSAELEPWLVFPMAFSIMFDVADALSEIVNAINSGNWISHPSIIFSGPMEGPIVENLTTGEKLELNYAIAVGEVVTIDTTPGVKTVTNNSGDNLLGYLSSDSDLGTFHLDPSPLAPLGVNRIYFSGINLGGVGQARIEWYNRYLGV